MADEGLKKKLRQLQRCLALAASDNENEARNAAVKACTIIRDEKLVFLTPDAFETLRNAVRSPLRSGEPYCINVREGGTRCIDCGVEFRRGDRAWFRAGVGAVHAMKCDPSLLL